MLIHQEWRKCLCAVATLLVLFVATSLMAGKGGNGGGGNGGGGGGGGSDPPPPDLPSFTMTVLGTLGGQHSGASAMNESGDIVGASTPAGSDTGEGFVYLRQAGVMIDLRDLVDPQVWAWFDPRGINDQGQICGVAYRIGDGGHAVRFTPADVDPQGNPVPTRMEIVTPPDAVINTWWYARGEGINESGDVTGEYLTQDATGSYIGRAFVHSDDVGSQDLGDLGGGGAEGLAINNFGAVAGHSRTADGNTHAFRFVQGLGMQDLGIIKAGPKTSPFADHSVGVDLNDAAVVVGSAIAGSHRGSAALHAFYEAGEGMQDLGTLGGSDSSARSINSHGSIVGLADDQDGVGQAFLATAELGMLGLEPLIVNLPPDASIIGVCGINDAGEICGTIRFTDGTDRAFLLTPNQ